MMGMGQSKAKRFDQNTDQRENFDEVADIEEAENEEEILKATGLPSAPKLIIRKLDLK